MRHTHRYQWLLVTACSALILIQFSLAQSKNGAYHGRKAAEGEVLVKFRQVSPTELTSIAKNLDLSSLRPSGGVKHLYHLRSRSKKIAELVEQLSARSDVVYAEPNFEWQTIEVPNDPQFGSQWALQNTGQYSDGFSAGTPGADIGAVSAWDISTGGTTHVVGVVDTGIDYTHPDLQANVWSAPNDFTVMLGGLSISCPAGSHGFNAIASSCDPRDDHMHGTHVSGTIGAVGNNGTGVVGVNWTTRIIGLKFLDSQGSGYTSDAVNAIEFAIQVKAYFAQNNAADVRILSNSWGGSSPSQALQDEIDRAAANDMLFVAAAGNSAANLDVVPMYPASFDRPNMIVVAATDNNDALAYFSNYGVHSAHLGAPGVSILSTLPNDTYGYLSGTSMATPHVSGAAALMLSVCDLSTPDLKQNLLDNVEVLPSLTGQTITGGRLDLYHAVRSCSGSVSLSPSFLSFGIVAAGQTSDPRSVTLKNYQHSVLNISTIFTTGDFTQTNNCPASLAPNSACTITLTFRPSSAGAKKGELQVVDDASSSPQSTELAGTGDIAGPVTHFSVIAPASAGTGIPFSITVTALDQSNLTAMSYRGTVHFTSSDPQATLPGNATLTNGTGTFSATLRTVGGQTITTTDAATGTITGTSANIVTVIAVDHFAVSAPASATAETPFNFTVTAQDPSNNVVPTYSGTVHFSSSDPLAVLPMDTTLVNGSGTFNVILRATGLQTITATDTVTGVKGVSGNISVAAAPRAAMPTFLPNPGTYTSPQSVTVADTTPGVTIYYTTDGSVPTTASPQYTGPITIPTTTTLQAIATGSGYSASSDAFGIYRLVAIAPTFSPNPGTYNTPQSVTLSDVSPGVNIYYTTDGSTPTTASPQYGGPIMVASTSTLQAIAAGNGYAASSQAFGIYKIVAVAPTFSPGSGTYSTAQLVTISDATPGASIYYTLDGSYPTTSSAQYNGPIAVSSTTTLEAIAAGNGYGASPAAFGIYKLAATPPSFSPSPGSYNSPQVVMISAASPGVSIYYTTDGTTPTTSSARYTGPITISSTTTLQAIAAGNGYSASSVGVAVYKIAGAATPTFSPGPGTYSAPQSVTIMDTSPGVSIYYTTDGSPPTTASSQYGGPIIISTTTTLQAIAAGNGYPASSVASGTYKFTTAAPAFSPSPGTYNTPQTITISDASPGATIYYTTDGSIPTTSSTQYNGPIAISTTTTLQAIAAANTLARSSTTFGIYRIVAATPTFSPNPGTYNRPQLVTIADTSPGVTIYYTIDGSTPSTASARYTGPITISTTTTLQAVAAGNGYGPGPQAFGIYRVVALAPSFFPAPGTYTGAQLVTIADVTPGVTIYYTVDGSTPTTSSSQYTGPIPMSTTTTLRAIAAGNGYAASQQAFGIYRMN